MEQKIVATRQTAVSEKRILHATPASAGAGNAAKHFGLIALSVLALVVGTVTGFGAVAFRDLIGLIHNAAFLGRITVIYDANIFTPGSPWGPFVILVPVAGALGVTFLVTTFAPEARGHGVPEVMDAIYYHAGVIRPVVAIVKSLASALAIGTGSAVGREGPIIQIGAAIGSSIGQITKMSAGQRIILVAAGAGAGIAATFNTPIGGVMFAIELMMPEVSVRTFLPVAISTGTATFVGRLFFGTQPAFAVPALAPMSTDASAAAILVLYAIMGAFIGLAATLFIRALHVAENAFDRIANRYLRHGVGMLLVGIMIYTLYRTLGHYYVEGVGYATVQAILTGQLSAGWLLLLLFTCKIAATSISLGSGSSGGIFSPSLFMGAALGGAFATLISSVAPTLQLNVPSFAMVGMGAMVGGGAGAAMTAVAMIFEMTRDYDIVLPMILAVAASLGVRRMLSRENIYTMKLVGRGHVIPKALHANMFLVRRAKDVMNRDIHILPHDSGFDEYLHEIGHGGTLQHAVVTRNGEIYGVIRVNTGLQRGLGAAHTGILLADVASRNFIVVSPDDVVFDVIAEMWQQGAIMAVVAKGGKLARADDVMGVITKEHVADSVAESIQHYPA
jgi:chloride channel protein, CIC family